MGQNIISERWEIDLSPLSLKVPSGGGTVTIPGVGLYDGRLRCATPSKGSSPGTTPAGVDFFDNADTVFIKRLRLYSPWLAFGAQIDPGSYGSFESLQLLEQAFPPVLPSAIVNTSRIGLGEWIDINTIMDKAPGVAGNLAIYVDRRPFSMLFPSSIPAAIVNRPVYTVLQVELAHTLPTIPGA